MFASRPVGAPRSPLQRERDRFGQAVSALYRGLMEPRIWHRRQPSTHPRTRSLHDLLDKVLAAGIAPVEIESHMVDLLTLARYRKDRGART
jgi:hypothetical protein